MRIIKCPCCDYGYLRWLSGGGSSYIRDQQTGEVKITHSGDRGPKCEICDGTSRLRVEPYRE